MDTIVITGGTGLVGRALTKKLLEKNYRVIILTRKLQKDGEPNENCRLAHWDVEAGIIEKDIFSTADHIIHLAGAGIADKRWSKKRKEEIVNSRVRSGELIANTLATVPNKIKTVVSASAIGWYGHDPLIPNPRPFVETDAPSNDFLGSTCAAWEESLADVTRMGKRLVKIRTGIVLSGEGGALREFIKPLQWGIATILGNGKQVISWIHIDDLVNIYLSAIENTAMDGAYNAVSPEPASNKEFVLTLARVRNRKRFMAVHVPSFILKTVLGEMSIEVLKSATVSAEKIRNSGIDFQYPSLDAAFSEIIR